MLRLLAAISFLTCVPVGRPFDARDVGRGALFFPLVGAGLGLLQLGAFELLVPRVPPLLAGVVVVSLSVWVTGALHLDGLADFADGLGGGKSREDSLRIMRDPSIGAFGAAALVLVLVLKIAAVSALRAPEALVIAPALSRWAAVPLGLLPYARQDRGLGSALTEHVGWFEVAGASILTGALLAAVAPRVGACCLAGAAAASLWTALTARKRLGGVTGDVLGANVELSEALALAAAAAC